MDGDLRFASGPDDYRIAYEVTGEGSPLVLLPGLGTDGRRWRELGYVARLAGKHRLILIDPLGHGRSDRPHDPADYTLEALAHHTAAVLDAERVSRADVWGYSRGCLLLVALMQYHGARVGSAVAGGIDLARLAPAEAGSSEAAPSESPAAVLRRGDWSGFWEVFGAALPAERRARAEQENDPLAIAAALDASASAAITVDPTAFRAMVYVGDGEPFATSTAAIAALLSLRCAVLPTGGHAETFEATDVVCSAVEPFLDGL